MANHGRLLADAGKHMKLRARERPEKEKEKRSGLRRKRDAKKDLSREGRKKGVVISLPYPRKIAIGRR